MQQLCLCYQPVLSIVFLLVIRDLDGPAQKPFTSCNGQPQTVCCNNSAEMQDFEAEAEAKSDQQAPPKFKDAPKPPPQQSSGQGQQGEGEEGEMQPGEAQV